MKKLIFILVLLGACVPEWKGSGIVTSKDYDPPYSYYVGGQTIDGGQTCSGSGSARSCTDNPDTYIPGHTQYVDEVWTLVVKGDKHSHDVEVPESVWNKCRVNQKYDTKTQECTSQ